jgi:hypothetical protein
MKIGWNLDENWMKIDENWMKIGWKLDENWMKIGWKLNENWIKIGWINVWPFHRMQNDHTFLAIAIPAIRKCKSTIAFCWKLICPKYPPTPLKEADQQVVLINWGYSLNKVHNFPIKTTGKSSQIQKKTFFCKGSQTPYQEQQEKVLWQSLQNLKNEKIK